MSREHSIYHYQDASLWLKEVYLAKKARNSSYSMRAFAKLLGLTHTVLTRFIQNKSSLSSESIQKISENLELNPLEKKYFEEISSSKPNHSILDQLRVQANTEKMSVDSFTDTLTLKTFALLHLIDHEGFSTSYAAKKLNSSPQEIELILENLMKAEFVQRSPESKFLRTLKRVVFETEKKSLVSFYQSTLFAAAKSLDSHKPSERAIGSETLSLDPNDLPQVSSIINECLDRIVALSKKSKNPSEIYHCNMTMFRVTENP